MIFFYKANGKLINTTQQFVFQGSSKANTIYFVCPTSPRNLINVAFKLPNGESVPQQLMTLTEDTGLTGVFDVKGEIFAMWRFDIPSAITAYKGTVLAQFYITSQGEEVLATESATIVVQKGVSNIEPEQIDTYQAVLNIITQIYSEIDNFPEDYQKKIDKSLTTVDKTIVGAVNEINDKVYNKISKKIKLNDTSSIEQVNGGVISASGSDTVPAKADGNTATALGVRTEALADTSFAANYNAKAYQGASAAFNNSVAGVLKYTLLFNDFIEYVAKKHGHIDIKETYKYAANNYDTCRTEFITTITDDTPYTETDVPLAWNGFVDDDGNIYTGMSNYKLLFAFAVNSSKALGLNSFSSGTSTAEGQASAAMCHANTVKAKYGFATNVSNLIEAAAFAAFVGGGYNTCSHIGAALFGMYNKSTHTHQLLCGRRNDVEKYKNALLAVGNGIISLDPEAETNSTCFAVLDDGSVKVPKLAVENDDAANKSYVDNAIKKINVPGGGSNIDLTEYVQKVKNDNGTYKHGIFGQDKNGVVSTTEVATNEAKPYTMVQRTGGGIVLVGDLDASQPMPSKQAVNKKCLYDIVKPYKHIVYIYVEHTLDTGGEWYSEIVYYSNDSTPISTIEELYDKEVASYKQLTGDRIAVDCKLEITPYEVEDPMNPENIYQAIDIRVLGLTHSWDALISDSLVVSSLDDIEITDTVVMR